MTISNLPSNANSSAIANRAEPLLNKIASPLTRGPAAHPASTPSPTELTNIFAEITGSDNPEITKTPGNETKGFQFTKAEEAEIFQHFSASEGVKKSEVKKMGARAGMTQYAVQAKGSDFKIELQVPDMFSKDKLKIVLQTAKDFSKTLRSDVPDQVVQGIPVDDLVVAIMAASPSEQIWYDMATMAQGEPGGDPKRHALQLIHVPNNINDMDNDEFRGVLRHEFLHVLGSSMDGTHWDNITETASNGDKLYTGEQGVKAYAQLHGLAEVPTSFKLHVSGGDHMPAGTYDTGSQFPHSRVLDGGGISGLNEAVLKDLGYDTTPPTFEKLIALQGQTAEWKPENPLTSDSGRFEANFDDKTGTIKVIDKKSGEDRVLAVAPDSSNAPYKLNVSSEGRVSLSSSSNKAMELEIRGDNHPQNSKTTSAIVLNDKGELQVADVRIGTRKKPGTKMINTNTLLDFATKTHSEL